MHCMWIHDMGVCSTAMQCVAVHSGDKSGMGRAKNMTALLWKEINIWYRFSQLHIVESFYADLKMAPKEISKTTLLAHPIILTSITSHDTHPLNIKNCHQLIEKQIRQRLQTNQVFLNCTPSKMSVWHCSLKNGTSIMCWCRMLKLWDVINLVRPEARKNTEKTLRKQLMSKLTSPGGCEACIVYMFFDGLEQWDDAHWSI